MGKYVVKVPRNRDGIRDNDWEGSISNGPNSNPLQDIQYARTRMHYWNEIPIVFMEYVEYANDAKVLSILGESPNWTWSVDGGQVGMNRRNQLVAFDYGCT